MRLHAVVARQAWCAASSTVYLQLRSQYKAMKSDGLDQTLETLSTSNWMLSHRPTGAALSPRGRAAWTTASTNNHASRVLRSSAQERTRLCPPWHHLTQLPCSLLNGDGTDGRGGVQGFPAVKLARLEKLPRQIVASVTVHMQVPMGLSM